MYLKSLTLKGFKSFAQPTTFQFEQGVTAVVGPNGSGKSNVVDGLAWVMGEQGAKTLRGGKMDDVIFAGTSTRGPLGRAEVTLTIDNSDGALPIEYTEVTISRILFRNGQSEYAINGESCRLLDVQELLSEWLIFLPNWMMIWALKSIKVELIRHDSIQLLYPQLNMLWIHLVRNYMLRVRLSLMHLLLYLLLFLL
jgi:recombinational DNA repair ATPase RecF